MSEHPHMASLAGVHIAGIQHGWSLGHHPRRSVFFSTGLILDLRQANERRRYFVTTSLIVWAQA